MSLLLLLSMIQCFNQTFWWQSNHLMALCESKIVTPIFFALADERARAHTWDDSNKQTNNALCACIRISTGNFVCAITSESNASAENRMLHVFTARLNVLLFFFVAPFVSYSTGNEHNNKKRNCRFTIRGNEEKEGKFKEEKGIKWCAQGIWMRHNGNTSANKAKVLGRATKHRCCRSFDANDFWRKREKKRNTLLFIRCCFIFTHRCAHRSRFQYLYFDKMKA